MYDVICWLSERALAEVWESNNAQRCYRYNFQIEKRGPHGQTRLPRRLLTAWVANSRPIGGTEMTYGRSQERVSSMLLFRSNSPSGRNSPETGRNGAPSSPRREHEITAQEVGIIQQQQKCHAIRDSHSKQRERNHRAQ